MPSNLPVSEPALETSSSSGLGEVMKGLDHAWANAEPDALARRMLEQAQTLGEPLTPREAILAAQLVERDAAMVSPESDLSEAAVKAFLNGLPCAPRKKRMRRVERLGKALGVGEKSPGGGWKCSYELGVLSGFNQDNPCP